MRRLAAPVVSIPTGRWLPPCRNRSDRKLSRLIWEPLCISALNTPIAAAFGAGFAINGGQLVAGASASDLLHRRSIFPELFPCPCLRWLACAHNRRAIKLPSSATTTASPRRRPGARPRAWVIATAPYHVRHRWSKHPAEHGQRRRADRGSSRMRPSSPPGWPSTHRSTSPADDRHDGGYGQWVFDRGALGGAARSGRYRHQRQRRPSGDRQGGAGNRPAGRAAVSARCQR